jgi:ribonuclease BN (tRNA processing enzyme)
VELVILGSGSAFPKGGAVRNPAGYAVLAGRDILLFDLGFGNLRQLARAGLSPARVTDVFLTHRHPDHVGDLPALLFLLRYDLKPRAGVLRLWGPRGLRRHVSGLRRLHAPWLEPRGYRLEVGELNERRQAQGAGWTVAALGVPHQTRALAYRLLYKGKTLVYSGDTGFCPELADFAAESDLFVIECTTSERGRMDGHLSPRLAVETVKASGCRKAVLSHLSPESEGPARARAKGNIVLARDFLRLIV